MMKRGLLITVLCALFLCSGAFAEDFSCAAWLPYWEMDASLEEADELCGQLDEVIAFAAIFDSKDAPLMLEDAERLLEQLQEHSADADVYLSIVNDIEVSDGKYENKSSDLLRRLFKDDASISRHIEQLFTLVDKYHLTGLEIDYENIKSDTALWSRFTVFIQKLYEQLSRENIKLRVVLSWDAPQYASLPDGPEYSVMCYNLYGYHSGPGPKADITFLDKTCAYYQSVPGAVRMAMATGGFDWYDGNAHALTQLQAESLLLDVGVTPERDAMSGALHASFILDDVTHEVWYADGATLQCWREIVSINGFEGIDLFRLGGNSLTDWYLTFLEAE